MSEETAKKRNKKINSMTLKEVMEKMRELGEGNLSRYYRHLQKQAEVLKADYILKANKNEAAKAESTRGVQPVPFVQSIV